MRLVTFCRSGGLPRIGIASEGCVHAPAADPVFATMESLIAAGPFALDRLRDAGATVFDLGDVRLLAPVPRPPEYLGVGLNYHDHVNESGIELPAAPLAFNKQTSCVTGPYDDIVVPKVSDQFDYEGELGIVIGHAQRRMSRDEARAAIFGYVVCNDLSVRDWQFASPTFTLGKSFDTHGPFGPWITTADEVPDAQALQLTTTVNGETRQAASTKDMIFDCVEIVRYLSQVMTLAPGTVIATGTPQGVGHFLVPPGYLREGDTVAVEIEGLGRIENRVTAEAERRA
jgi:2-keto-4-pentenoate hydratase/2-oxohepta-3-ene-1,7-dioic acid hydratase in catechol pathway